MSAQFDKEYKAASLNVSGLSAKVVKAIALDLFSSIVKTTPVDTGRLRGNWQVSIENPVMTTVSSVDKTGAGTINQAETEIKNSDLGQTIYFTNNLPYATTIEYGRQGGVVGSIQAPQGMVRINVARFQQIVDEQARKNK